MKFSDEHKRKIALAKIAVILTIALAIPAISLANAEVNVEQSQSSNINGVQSSMQSDNGNTVFTTAHGKLILTGDHIQYCGKKCGPTYKLSDNGTIQFP